MCHATSAAIAKVNERRILRHICPHTAICVLVLHHTKLGSSYAFVFFMFDPRICVCMHENGFYKKLPQIDSLAIQPVQFLRRVQPLVDSVILRYVSIRQHTSAYVSNVSIRQHTSAYVRIRLHTSAYVSIRQHTSAYVSLSNSCSGFSLCSIALF